MSITNTLARRWATVCILVGIGAGLGALLLGRLDTTALMFALGLVTQGFLLLGLPTFRNVKELEVMGHYADQPKIKPAKPVEVGP